MMQLASSSSSSSAASPLDQETHPCTARPQGADGSGWAGGHGRLQHALWFWSGKGTDVTQGEQRQKEELVFIQSLYEAKPLLKESGSMLSIPFPLSPTPDNSSRPKNSCVVSNQSVLLRTGLEAYQPTHFGAVRLSKTNTLQAFGSKCQHPCCSNPCCHTTLVTLQTPGPALQPHPPCLDPGSARQLLSPGTVLGTQTGSGVAGEGRGSTKCPGRAQVP